jgi:thiamine pyrophosphate-dependent acetolactate synthase large subunit-like protein
MILLGGGAVDAGEHAARLAAATGARIVTTGNAKGAVDPSLGCYCPGGLSSEAVLHELATADVVLAVGTELAATETLPLGHPVDISGVVVRVDLDEHEPIGHETVYIRADALTTLELLAKRAVHGKRRDPQPLASIDAEPEIRPPHPEFAPWLAAMSRGVPLGSMMAVDSTQLGYHAHRDLPWFGSRTWFAPFSYGTLGAAVPLAVGARAGRPDRRSFAIAGDAGALFTIAELASAVDHNLPITVVVWNNGGYGEIRDAMTAAGVVPVEPRSSLVDYVRLAESLGCRAIRVTTPDGLADALSSETLADSTVVIDVHPGRRSRHA